MKLSESMAERAIYVKEVEMFIQFIVSTEEEKIIAAEALAGWKGAGQEMMHPEPCMNEETAEKDGQALDLYMFENVCRKLDAWRKKGWENLQLYCNFARSDFSCSFLAEKMIQIAQKYDFSPDRLIVQITENAAEDVHFFTSRILRKLRDFGFRIALDDFGTGAASIKDMQILPLDILKLDKALLRGAWSPAGEKVFTEVVRMGKSLQHKVVCEGVETEAERQIARRAGVDAVQGYLYYMPVPEKEADHLLEQYYGWNRAALAAQ